MGALLLSIVTPYVKSLLGLDKKEKAMVDVILAHEKRIRDLEEEAKLNHGEVQSLLALVHGGAVDSRSAAYGGYKGPLN